MAEHIEILKDIDSDKYMLCFTPLTMQNKVLQAVIETYHMTIDCLVTHNYNCKIFNQPGETISYKLIVFENEEDAKKCYDELISVRMMYEMTKESN